MAKTEDNHIEELTWEHARPLMAAVNPELAAIIDGISPDKRYTFFKIRYSYGSEILKRAKFQLPNKYGNLVPIDNPSIDSRIQDALGYNLDSNPVMMVLNNSLELFLPLDDRTVPFGNLIYPGSVVGTYRLLTTDKVSHHPIFIWDMTAGARSIFLLSKISDMEKHKKLRKTFAVTIDKPKSYMDHWKIFREMANSDMFPKKWNVDILFFAKKWFENLSDPSFIHFNYYLYRRVWNGSDYWRNVFFWNVIFSLIQEELGIKPTPYAMGTVKHLLAVGVGEAPAFAPAIDDSAGPILEIQNVCLDIYGLDYAPIIMQPSIFSLKSQNCHPVYYSLRFANAMEFWPKSRERNSYVNELFEIKGLLNHYIRKMSTNEFNLDRTPFYEAINKVNYDYFHNDVELMGIGSSSEIATFDPRFSLPIACRDKKFPENSSFFKGCIRFSKKK